jgi:hypothetical protein
VARPVQDRRDESKFGRPGTEHDASEPDRLAEVIAVASTWLAFYGIAAVHHLLASAN